MKKYLIIIFIFLCASLFGNEDNADIRKFSINDIQKIGKKIYEKDIYASKATDIVLSKNKYKKKLNQCIGWLGFYDKKNYKVAFVSHHNDSYKMEIIVIFKNIKQYKIIIPENEYLDNENTLRFKSRQLALKNITKICSKNVNTIVLDDENSGSYLVYVLSTTLDPDEIVIGLHYRFTISKNAEKIIQIDKLSKSCFTLHKNPPELPKGAELSAYTMSHIISDTPVETHVYLNLLHKKPFFIKTGNNQIWMVKKGKIYKM